MENQFSVNAHEELYKFIKNTHGIQSIDELNKRFGQILEGYGFTTYICTELGHSLYDTKPAKLFGKWNPEWDQRYFKEQYFQYDDCLRYLTSTTQTFSWSEVKNSKFSTSRGLRVMDEAKNFKAKEGLLVPLRSFDGRFSVVTMMGDSVDISEYTKITLEVASLYFSEV